MELNPAQLKVLLLGANILTSEQFERAEKESKGKDVPLDIYLSESGTIADEHLGQIIANYLKLDFVDLLNKQIEESTLKLIPEVAANEQKIVAYQLVPPELFVATSNPDNQNFFKQLEKKTGYKINVGYATPWGVKEALRNYKRALQLQVQELIKSVGKSDSKEITTKLVDLLLEYAKDERASDVHIEPLEDSASVRFRVDGVLHEVTSYPKSLHENVVFRIKIISGLRTDEQDSAQDGRFQVEVGGGKVEVRVSILPITKGENVVMRLLSEGNRQLSMEDLGFAPEDLEKLKNAAAKPYGMILAVGPTGSGKTTSLYAILKILNKPEVNIMTVEDPVEFEVDHVQQTQVNVKKELTFAKGLRSIVRQDPDIIMVGEIRDNETASIAVNAGMTGHLVLSTLHANDAATTFPRMIDMGIEPFLLASGLNIVIAQRLVRNICDGCRASHFFTEKELEVLNREPELAALVKKVSGKEEMDKIRAYKGAGCKSCGDTGYKGRTGIFEVLEVNDELRSLITQKATADIITQKARELGVKSMFEDGIAKVLQGVTTLEEIIRATKS